MWVELEDSEIETIVTRLGTGSIVEKLLERPHPHTGAFLAAAAEIEDRHFDPDPAGIIRRERDCAWVLGWVRIRDDEADVPTSFEMFSLEETTLTRLRAFENLRVHSLWVGSDPRASARARGVINEFEWWFEALSNSWSVHVRDKTGQRHLWLYCVPYADDSDLTEDKILSLILTALEHHAARPADQEPDEPTYLRHRLLQCAYGDMSIEEAGELQGMTPRAYVEWAKGRGFSFDQVV